MKKVLILLSFLAICGQTMAQGDAKAKNVLNKVSKNLKSLKSMTASFKISINDKSGKSQGTKAGTVAMQGNKFVLKISGQEIYNNGTTSWTYIKESNEVQVNEVDADDDAFTPSKLFTNFYEKEYAYKYLTAKSGVIYIGLVPLKKSMQFDKIVLKVSEKSNTVIGGTVYDKNGNIYKYSVYNYKKNPSIASSSFEFNQANYSGVEVIDLR